MKNLLIGIVICIGFSSCCNFSEKVDKFMSKNFRNSGIENQQEVDLQDILGIKIDEVYLFSEVTSNAEISAVTGIKLPYKDITWSWQQKWHIICIYNNLITYDEVYEQRNIYFKGNDTTIYFPKNGFTESWPYSHIIPPSCCKYKIFRSPHLLIKREFDKEKNKFNYELSAK